MPEDEVHPIDDNETGSTYHRRVVTTETVKRGDLYVPLADRFDRIERRVSLLTWVVVIDIVLTMSTNPSIGIGAILKLLERSVGG